MQNQIKIMTKRLMVEELHESDFDFIVALEQIPENIVYEMEGVL